MGIFDDAKTVMIGNKEVQSIITSNGGVIYEKPSSYELALTSNKSIIQTGESATLTATLTQNGVGISGETIYFDGGCNIRYDTYSNYDCRVFTVSGDGELSFTGGTLIISQGTPRIKSYNYDGVYDISISNSVLSITRDNTSVSILNFTFDSTKPLEIWVVKEYPISINTWGFGFSAVTDANGVASVSYVGKGVGDVDVQASYGNLLSEIFVIEDCYSYDPTNYTTTTLTSITLPSEDFELSYRSILKTVTTGHNTNLNIYGTLNDEETEVISVIGLANNQCSGWHLSFVTGGNWEIHCESVSGFSANDEYTVRYTYINNVHSLYINDELITSTEKVMLNMHDVYVGIAQNEFITDLKVKKII